VPDVCKPIHNERNHRGKDNPAMNNDAVERFIEAWKSYVQDGSRDWMKQAHCAEMYDEFDLNEENERKVPAEKIKLLRKICEGCPVKQECLNDTLLFSDEHTFRAGLMPSERKRLMSKSGELTWDKKQQILKGNL